MVHLKSKRKCAVTIGRYAIVFYMGYIFCLYYVIDNQCFAPPSHQILKHTNNNNFSSTCNWESDQRGSNQKVIAYSIYGNLSNTALALRYLKCFKVTLGKIPTVFPGWVVRIYHNVDSNDETGWKNLQDSLPVERNFIDLCNATEIIKRRSLGNLFPMTWRFLPMLDDLVDISLSRDSDSPLLPREEAAVGEWLKSNQTFHIMRDDPRQCYPPILGGLWGAKVRQNRPKISRVFNFIMTRNHSQTKGSDQKLLTDHVWPFAKKDAMAHDSYCCKHYPGQPFPTQREGGAFVGIVQRDGCQLDFSHYGNVTECPKPCRPKNTLTVWRFC